MLILAGFIWRPSDRKQIKSHTHLYCIGSADGRVLHGNWMRRRTEGPVRAGWWRRGEAGGLGGGSSSRFYLKSVIYQKRQISLPFFFHFPFVTLFYTASCSRLRGHQECLVRVALRLAGRGRAFPRSRAPHWLRPGDSGRFYPCRIGGTKPPLPARWLRRGTPRGPRRTSKPSSQTH